MGFISYEPSRQVNGGIQNMDVNAHSYEAEQIQVLEGLEAVRRRPR